VVVKIIYDGILAEFGAVKLQTLQEIKIISSLRRSGSPALRRVWQKITHPELSA